MVAYVRHHKYKIVVLLALIGLLLLAQRLGLGEFLSFDGIRAQVGKMRDLYQAHPAAALSAYVIAYVLATGLSIPIGNALSIVGGAVFGLVVTLPLAVLCTSAGATIAFLLSRHLLGDWVERRHGKRIDAIHEELRRYGAFYLIALRWIMIVPFALINWAMGLSPMKARVFFLGTLVGQIPINFLFVKAGGMVASLDSLAGVLSMRVLLALATLAALPVALIVRAHGKSARHAKDAGPDSKTAPRAETRRPPIRARPKDSTP